MKNIRMCNEEIERYFNEEGKLNIKVRWGKREQGFCLNITLFICCIILVYSIAWLVI